MSNLGKERTLHRTGIWTTKEMCTAMLRGVTGGKCLAPGNNLVNGQMIFSGIMFLINGWVSSTYNLPRRGEYATVCMKRSEDNLWESLLSFNHVGPRIKLRSSGLAASDFTHCSSSLPHGPHWYACTPSCFLSRLLFNVCHGMIKQEAPYQKLPPWFGTSSLKNSEK